MSKMDVLDFEAGDASGARSPRPPMRSDPVAAPSGPMHWTRDTIDIPGCVIELNAEQRDEVGRLANWQAAQGASSGTANRPEVPVPALESLMKTVRARLETGPGVAVVDRLDLDQLSVDDARSVYWALCQMIAQPVAQTWSGTLLYDVADTGNAYSYGVRGSTTNVELVFHNDNAFGRLPPDYVALLCIWPAVHGGASRFCSLYSVHDELRDTQPDVLERLYQPFLWDRQAEHGPGAPLVARAPVFCTQDGRLKVRANHSLIRKGYEVAGQELDEAGDRALTTLASLMEQKRFWFELPVERGQMQFINNRETAHYRSAFEDSSDPDRRRRLIRVWMRASGGPGYDG